MWTRHHFLLTMAAGVLLFSGEHAVAQDAAAPPPVPATAETAPAAEAKPAADATPNAAAPTQAQSTVEPAKPVGPAAAPKQEVAKKGMFGLGGKKEPYTGPTEVIVLAPTPMLDEEGKQRVDPDGKLMFNPPVKQQRDKFGHPLFDENKKPVFQTPTELGYDEQGKKIHVEKVKPPKMTPVIISRGTFTVDGVIGKAEMNYDIADLKFIYLYVPGMGVTVVSNQMFPGAKAQDNAFDGPTLTVKADDHTLQIGSDKRLLQEKKPVPAFVLVDREFRLPSRYPVVGYGTTAKAPYSWPGSKANTVLAGAPPVPQNLRPTILLQPCAKGEMRMPAPKVLPGEVAPDQPCVPIAKAQAAAKAMATAGSPAPAPAK